MKKKNVVKYVENFINGNNKIVEIEDVMLHKREFVDFGANYIYRKNKSSNKSTRRM